MIINSVEILLQILNIVNSKSLSRNSFKISSRSMSTLTYKYVFKYIIVGDSGVGKSCLLMQFTDKRFGQRDPTIGVEFASRLITLSDCNVKLQVWDTAGQEAYGSITRSYYKAAAGALIVYDITRRKSFDNVKKWLNEIREGGSKTLQMLLVGNKTDLASEREVSYIEGEALAKEYKIGFIETSAKTAHNVEDVKILFSSQKNYLNPSFDNQAFIRTAEKIHDGVLSGEIDIESQRSGVKLGDAPATKAKEKSLKDYENQSTCTC